MIGNSGGRNDVKHAGVEWIGQGPLHPSTGDGIYARCGRARPTELCPRGTPRRLARRLERGARPPTQACGKEGYRGARGRALRERPCSAWGAPCSRYREAAPAPWRAPPDLKPAGWNTSSVRKGGWVLLDASGQPQKRPRQRPLPNGRGTDLVVWRAATTLAAADGGGALVAIRRAWPAQRRTTTINAGGGGLGVAGRTVGDVDQ